MNFIKKYKIYFIVLSSVIIVITVVLIFIPIINNKQSHPVNDENTNNSINNETPVEYIKENIVIKDIDGNNTNYEFIYNEETYIAVYTLDNWKIYNSYKIKNTNDIKKICQALIDIHPVHGNNLISYRNADDMTFEWLQHNIAYDVLPENNKWRENAKDVDLDPQDQNKTFKEIYESRTGEVIDLDELMK